MAQPSSFSNKPIQRRLIIILARALLVMAVFGIVAVLAYTIIQISQNTGRNPFYRDPNATILEAYYLGRGSWDGVESVVEAGQDPASKLLMMDWEQSILIDKYGNVIMYYGQIYDSIPPGSINMPLEVVQTPLRANGKVIGSLISQKRVISQPVRLTLGVMNPVFRVAALLILLTVVIGVLLMRRVVNPLSEVIAAAQSVAAGNLGTRIKLQKSNADLYTLSNQFNKMTETLERNDNERRAMLADIAHELRTPLTILRGRLEGIMDGVYSPNEDNIAPALEETYLLERLVDDLHLLTLAETRQLHLEMKDTNLVELLRKTVSIFEPQAAVKNVSLTFETDSQELIANVDPQRIEQVIGNLIGNALRFVPENGKITVTSRQEHGDVQIIVSDNGPGVKEEDLPFIFDRFWRGEKSRTRSSGGAGLGLAISKQLIEFQGGKITAANRAEGGLQVTVEIPIKNDKDNQ
ncbi:MAG TPA: hypothetical protein DD636_01185 [Anaerolineaceae bacterium]|nr:hypothetical protein [Anaerolineaceae bacterium]